MPFTQLLLLYFCLFYEAPLRHIFWVEHSQMHETMCPKVSLPKRQHFHIIPLIALFIGLVCYVQWEGVRSERSKIDVVQDKYLRASNGKRMGRGLLQSNCKWVAWKKKMVCDDERGVQPSVEKEEVDEGSILMSALMNDTEEESSIFNHSPSQNNSPFSSPISNVDKEEDEERVLEEKELTIAALRSALAVLTGSSNIESTPSPRSTPSQSSSSITELEMKETSMPPRSINTEEPILTNDEELLPKVSVLKVEEEIEEVKEEKKKEEEQQEYEEERQSLIEEILKAEKPTTSHDRDGDNIGYQYQSQNQNDEWSTRPEEIENRMEEEEELKMFLLLQKAAKRLTVLTETPAPTTVGSTTSSTPTVVDSTTVDSSTSESSHIAPTTSSSFIF